MSELAAIEAIVGPTIIVWFVLRHHLPDRGGAANLELAGFAIALAIGFSSATFFVWRALALPLRPYPAFDLSLQVLLAAGAAYLARRSTRVRVPAATDRDKATKAMVKAEHVCLISNSLVARRRLEPTVIVG